MLEFGSIRTLLWIALSYNGEIIVNGGVIEDMGIGFKSGFNLVPIKMEPLSITKDSILFPL